MSFYDKRTRLPVSTFKMMQSRLPVLLEVLEKRLEHIDQVDGIYLPPSSAKRLRGRYNALIRSVEKLQTLQKHEV